MIYLITVPSRICVIQPTKDYATRSGHITGSSRKKKTPHLIQIVSSRKKISEENDNNWWQIIFVLKCNKRRRDSLISCDKGYPKFRRTRGSIRTVWPDFLKLKLKRVKKHVPKKWLCWKKILEVLSKNEVWFKIIETIQKISVFYLIQAKIKSKNCWIEIGVQKNIWGYYDSNLNLSIHWISVSLRQSQWRQKGI